MATTSYLMAMGPFSFDIQDHLEYPREYYEDVKPGVTVFGCLFHTNGKGPSTDLAKALGTKLLDFNTHEIDVKDVSSIKLRELGVIESDIASMIELYHSNFKFYFRVDQ